MLGRLVMSAALVSGLHALRVTPHGAHAGFEREVSEAASELAHRAEALDVAVSEAAAALAVAPGTEAYEQLATELKASGAASDPAVRTLWRALQAHFSDTVE